jgi:4-diphosphocytidyl-2-C-methyl-D-erythritol kinase
MREVGNALEETVLRLSPGISKVIREIESTGPMLCGISGSGASCFGIYSSAEDAQVASAPMRAKYHYVEISRIMRSSQRDEIRLIVP